MKKNRLLRLRAALLILTLSILFIGAADYRIDDCYSLRTGAALPNEHWFTVTPCADILPAGTTEEIGYTVRVGGFLPFKHVEVRRYDDLRLCPGGMPFGTKLFTDGLIVVGFTDVDTAGGAKQPAYDAGIRMNDIILAIDGTAVHSAENMASRIGSGNGEEIAVKIRRGEEVLTLRLTPALSVSENQYKTGMWVRDNTAGIGTVTFVNPETGLFGGLGHGICDAQSGALLPLARGIITDVTISGVQKGESGTPGELKGYFSSGKNGVLLGNSDAGVFGVLSVLPKGISAETALPIALKNEIKDGKAQIYCTLDESGIHAYEVSIRKIKNSPDNKNMEVTVTDPALLEKTGGIVQGMSGSPVIQNGRIVGAVTHVLINDPTRGYGIFIENMLEAAEQ